MEQFYIDEPCVVSFAIGEYGWILQRWTAHLRYLKHDVYPNHKFILFTNTQLHTFVDDFITYTIDLPDWFYKLKLDRDCYEAVEEGAPAGSLTSPEVYSRLINYIRQFYNPEKAIEVWPPRGCNIWVDDAVQIFKKITTKSEPFIADKYILVVFPRKRDRASNRNVPEFIWLDTIEKLRKEFLVVLAGTPEGAGLIGYKNENVINLIDYNEEDKTDLIIRYLNSAACSISSQSGGTHMSLLCGCASYIIGHEKERHSEIENRLNVPASFRYVYDYRAIDSDTIVSDVKNFIQIMINEKVLQIPFFIGRPSLKTLQNKKDLIGAEIGVDRGLNALNILENLDIKKLYLIDPYTIYKNLVNIGCNLTEEQCVSIEKEAHDRLEKYSDKIVWIKDLSENAVDKIPDELDFVYIDGNHRYEYTKKDLELYYPKVKDGGLLGCHDYDYLDTAKAIDEFFGNLHIKHNSERCADNPSRLDTWVVKFNRFKIIADDIIKLKELCREE
uniref:Putative methyltransferase n=1 Tax=viral metagenome TaxID=1070528 RepID=A0A6H1ZIS5_9ZZZZ